MTEPEHYVHFPCMKPHKGDRYQHPTHKKLLVIGESNYPPDGFKMNPETPFYDLREDDLGRATDSKQGQKLLEVKCWLDNNKIIDKDLREDHRNGDKVRAYEIYRRGAITRIFL